MHISAFIVPSKTCKLPIPYALMHPIPSEMLAFELNADNTLEGLPPPLPGGHGVCDFQQECQIWTRLAIKHFSTSKQIKQALVHRTRQRSGPCSHMASFLHDRALVGLCRWHGGLCLLTVVSESIPGPI